ncbi:12116_t:CDS:2 [Acaulospora morrowiae]|uniref:12116_t:CDS:1 n=1 Tax=Acaulospora morrowiae TaxID=94023 RepID=A0A9N9CTL1_9GLOM|nr:12116_t:CDS:2 [Acaulospora morrowiae]
MSGGSQVFISFYFTALVSSIYIPSDEVKIEIKNKVIKVFPNVDKFSIDQLVYVLALIWNIETGKCDSPSLQNDPYVKLKVEPSFFKARLPRVNYYNPFYDDQQFKEAVSFVKEKIKNNIGDIVVLAGVSGGGKTSTMFGIAMQRWSIYIEFSPGTGTYGNHVGKELETIKDEQPKFERHDQQRHVFRMLDGLRTNDSKIRTKLARENYDTFNVNALIESINDCLNVESLTLIFDEAQVLCRSEYGEYKGSSVPNNKWNLLQAYIEHLTNLPVTCLLAGTYMHMSSGISFVTSVGKKRDLKNYIVLKLPFLLYNDILQSLNAVIDLTDVSLKILNLLGCLLKGRPRNCVSFVRLLILEWISVNRTKDQKNQEIIKLLEKWYKMICEDMADYLENACKYLDANNLNPDRAIIDVLRLRVFYNRKYESAIKLLQHSIIPCKSPECITLGPSKLTPDIIEINTSLESYLVSSIELFLKNTRRKTLVEIFIDKIIRLDGILSIGNEFDAIFITVIIQKRGINAREELNRWKNGQQFDLSSWITFTMKFVTISNLSKAVPIAKYVEDETYSYYAIQPDTYSGSDLVISLVDDKQNIVLLSASCTVSGSPIKRDKIKKQLIKSCMKFQYMECPRRRKNSEIVEFSPCKKRTRLQTGLDVIPDDTTAKENDSEEDEGDLEEEDYGQDLNFDDVDYDLDYTKNIKKYRISNVSERAENHEKIKTSTENRKHIYVSVELPHRCSKRPELFRFNEYGDLVIIVDDCNMEHIFGPVIKELVDSLRFVSLHNKLVVNAF